MGSEDFKYLSEKFRDEKFKLVKQKEIYSYEYMHSFKNFKESKLPDIDCFFSLLKGSNISEKEHRRAVKVWKVF